MSDASETLEPIRAQRERLSNANDDLEEAITGPAGDADLWKTRVTEALVEMSAAVDNHVEMTEGDDGLYADIIERSPRLIHQIDRLKLEHDELKARVDNLESLLVGELGETQIDWIRDQAFELFDLVSRHRGRGSDLIYESYDFDIGESE